MDSKDLGIDLKFYNASSIDELSDNDRKYFETGKQADAFECLFKSLN